MSVKLINDANILLNALIREEQLDQKKKMIAQNISKNIKIDGFRKGKVPLNIIENRFKDKIEQDSQNEALNDLIRESLKELNIELERIIGNPLISKFQKIGNDIEVEAKIGIFPNVELKDYEKLIPIVELNDISDDDVDSRIKDLAKSNGELVEISKEKGLESGDIANIDFEGFLDETPFDGGKADNYDLEIGSNSFIEGFESQLIGMQKGDTKDINVRFPDNYNATHLAGREVRFNVKLNTIKERKPVNIDDDFAKKMIPNNSEATIDTLKENIKTQLYNENKSKAINDLKSKLIENLIGGIEFDLPDNIVEQEIDVIFRNSLQSMDKDELKELQSNKDKAKEKRESYREEAQKSVKLTFIIDTFAKKDNVSVNENELYQVIYYEAMMVGANPKDVIERYESNNMIPALKMTILENKILNNLLESTIKKDN